MPDPRFPCLAAFERDDDLALWIWTYRVWNGWKWPKPAWGMVAIPVVERR